MKLKGYIKNASLSLPVTLFVSRHQGALEWFLKSISGDYVPCAVGDKLPNEPVILVAEQVNADDVLGRVVVGNLPLHLACYTKMVAAIEFDGPPPRGEEYSAEDMEKAGARLRLYQVHEV